MGKQPILYTEITAEDKKMIADLQFCTFLPASFDKKFARDMSGAEKISEKQREYLKKLHYKYRKQISIKAPKS